MDQDYRRKISTHYVTVAYFEKGEYIKTHTEYYGLPDAERIYNDTVKKYKKSAQQVLIAMRDKKHLLVKSHLNFVPVFVKMSDVLKKRKAVKK